jgi:hypothetical protein
MRSHQAEVMRLLVRSRPWWALKAANDGVARSRPQASCCGVSDENCRHLTEAEYHEVTIKLRGKGVVSRGKVRRRRTSFRSRRFRPAPTS